MKHTESLEKRFHQPNDWQTRYFNNDDTGHHLYFGWASPQKDKPKGVVILLQGLQEFTEKYYETSRFFLDNGFGVVLFDWHYQGRSGRLSSSPHKRHSDGFDTDIDDLKRLIEEEISYIFPSLPLHMLSHSTGGNIGLRYLIAYPNDFTSASFSAPLMGIHGLSAIPDGILDALIRLLKIIPHAYVPGGKDWKASDRKSDGTDKFSSDPVRDSITNAWYQYDPSLQGGSPTISWLFHAVQSMTFLKNSGALKEIKTPCYAGLAENDQIVCTKTALEILQQITNCKIDVLPKAKHEILMETDDIRHRFLENALALMNGSKL